MKKLLLSILISLAINFGKGALPVFSKSINSSSAGFIENKGQIVDQEYHPNPGVKFLLCRPGFNVQLRETGFSYDTYIDSVIGQSSVKSLHSQLDKSIAQPVIQRHFHRVDVELLNCNKDAQLIAYEPSHACFNYFTGGAPEGGVSNVHYYQRVTYINIYPYIDLEFKNNSRPSGGAEYDFIVHPGGKISDIQLSYSGAYKTFLENNMLKVQVAAGIFTENIPSSYLIDNPQATAVSGQLHQGPDNGRQTVDVQYRSSGNNVYSFQLQSTISNPLSTIIIDPTPNLAWGSYYGGSGSNISGLGDQGNSIAIDRNGNVCITGYTLSTNNIATAGAYQTSYGTAFTSIFVSQFSPAGALNWGTYYNGTHGGVGYGWSIAVDTANNIYIAGETNMSGMASGGAYQTTLGGGGSGMSAIVAKFNSAGNQLIWGTYYAGNVITSANEIALDAANNVYIMGWTEASNLPTSNNAYQPLCDPPPTRGITGQGNESNYVAKFNSTGTSLLWGTYFGGQTYGQDSPGGIAVDRNNNVYITGITGDVSGKTTTKAYETAFPAGTNPAIFMAKLNPALSGAAQLVWGTYYGGSEGSTPGGIALDAGSNVYITGTLLGIDTISPFPTTKGTYQPVAASGNNAYIAKFNPSLLDSNQLVWGTYYGAGLTLPKGIAVDTCRNVTITGWTNSDTLIATPGAWQVSLGISNGTVSASEDAFVARFDSSGKNLLWGTYYGGSGQDNANAIALNGSDVFISGLTSSADSIATAGTWQTTYPNTFTNTGSSWEWSGFVAEFNNAGCLTCFLSSVSISSPKDSICFGDNVTLTASSTPAGTSYLWNTGATTQSITIDTTGNYSCIVYSCQDTVHASPVQITVVPAPAAPDIKQQHDTLYFTKDLGYTSYQWYDSATLIPGAIDTFLVITHSGNYNVKVENAFGCVIAVGINAIFTPNGFNEYSNNNYISLSPNPATNQLTIHTSSFHDKVATISIINVLGQEASPPAPLQMERGDALIDVSKLAAGMYFLQLKAESGSAVRKFVKE